jgi:bacterioferritin (cytochrome b1)
MIEALIPLAIATVAAGATLNNRLHQRINNVHDRIGGLDRRIDQVELTVAQDYVTKTDLQAMIDRVEAHMVRIENKLDQIALRNS